jgi:type 1 glutamine amidotransferase/nicotinamidase-related amidase
MPNLRCIGKHCFFVILLTPLTQALAAAEHRPPDAIELVAQSRENNGNVARKTVRLLPARTAVVVVDMWDRHWCETFTARVGNLAPQMNRTLEACRKLGIQVVFAPSDVVDFYKDFPQRKAMQAIPQFAERQLGAFSPIAMPLPIDNCECGPSRPCRPAKVWTRQCADLVIAGKDLIGDGNNGRELLNFCQQRRVDTLLYMGVSGRMCSLGQSCGILNMKRHGIQPIVVGDLVTAITANGIGPNGKPDRNFTPAKGSAIVVQHMEQHLAPSIRSRQLIALAGLDPHAGDVRPHIVFVTAEREYESNKTLPTFARKYLEKDFRCTHLNATGPEQTGGKDDVPGLQALYDADLLVLAARRRTFPAVQMDHLEKYIRSGMPMVVLRTSGAAFQMPQAPLGHVVWDRFDKEVLGCNYQGYNAKSRQTGCDVWTAPGAGSDPILQGVAAKFHSPCWIYRQRPLAGTTKSLLIGRWSKEDPEEPVAWTNTYQNARVFYTTLGHPGDFQIEAFNRLLLNAIRWSIERAD